MKISYINEKWCSIVELTDPNEFFSQPNDFWRQMLYDRKIIIFKKINFTPLEYAKFGFHFGKPWTFDDYKHTKEKCLTIYENDQPYYYTEWSNIIHSGKITNGILPLHADVPIRPHDPYPIRSLWMIKNPNGEISGHTHFLNIEYGMDLLPKELIDLIPRVKLLQQNSYVIPPIDEKMYDFTKVHPVTLKETLRLNYYVNPNFKYGWIKEVYIDNIKQPDQSLIQEYLDAFSKIPELYYEHVWDTLDIAIYDNYPLVHGRTKLVLGDTPNLQERLFYRLNIDHMSNVDFFQN